MITVIHMLRSVLLLFGNLVWWIRTLQSWLEVVGIATSYISIIILNPQASLKINIICLSIGLWLDNPNHFISFRYNHILTLRFISVATNGLQFHPMLYLTFLRKWPETLQIMKFLFLWRRRRLLDRLFKIIFILIFDLRLLLLF